MNQRLLGNTLRHQDNWIQTQLQEQQSQTSSFLQDMVHRGSLTLLTPLTKAQLLGLQLKWTRSNVRSYHGLSVYVFI